MRSVLLDVVKTKKWELIDARGHIVQYARDQHGSRFIQQKLESRVIQKTLEVPPVNSIVAKLGHIMEL